MNLDIQGHHIDITEPLREYSEKKFLKIKKHFSDLISIKMFLAVQKNTQKAEATIHVSGFDFFAKIESSDMYLSINKLVDKLDSQIVKHKEKLNSYRS